MWSSSKPHSHLKTRAINTSCIFLAHAVVISRIYMTMASPRLARTWMLQAISESSSRRTVQWISRLSEDTLGLRRRSIFMAMDSTYRKPGPRRLSCAQTVRAQAARSVMITVHSRPGVMCVRWCSNTAHDAVSKSANPPSLSPFTPPIWVARLHIPLLKIII